MPRSNSYASQQAAPAQQYASRWVGFERGGSQPQNLLSASLAAARIEQQERETIDARRHMWSFSQRLDMIRDLNPYDVAMEQLRRQVTDAVWSSLAPQVQTTDDHLHMERVLTIQFSLLPVEVVRERPMRSIPVRYVETSAPADDEEALLEQIKECEDAKDKLIERYESLLEKLDYIRNC